MREFFGCLGVALGATFVLLAIVMAFENYSCHRILDKQQIEGEWGLWTDCMVKEKDGNFVPLKYYNIQEAIKRGTSPNDLSLYQH